MRDNGFFWDEDDETNTDQMYSEEEQESIDDWEFDECEHEDEPEPYPEPETEAEMLYSAEADDLSDPETYFTFDLDESAEAHINEVTSMELPMDWENIYDTDDSVAGVYALSRKQRWGSRCSGLSTMRL